MVQQDITLDAKGEVDMFRTKLRVSFKYELGWSKNAEPI